MPDDLRRNEMGRIWSKRKPYFTLRDGALELHGTPVPPSPPPETTLSFWQHAFGWSVLVDTVANRLGRREPWIYDNERVLPPGAGLQLACPLMRRLAALKRPMLIVAQYDATAWHWGADHMQSQRDQAQAVLRCAADAGLVAA